jgi:hypothetical protein
MGGRNAATLDWSEISVGDVVAPLELAMSATRIVAGAIATRDFMPVHHDRAYANGQGAPDIFMNILSSNAYCSRFLTDWAGPEAMVKRLSIRLGVPAFPGSPLTFTGKVTATKATADEGLVDVEFRATTNGGDHLIGTATLSVLIRRTDA